ncbi:hypothetical protein CAPTEDRAFT_204007 [Capitella teleta]|uniref:SUEL-type lectin domain-containing protein n=1 Tax=Capitella teleta TaxID=283909 RepID=R7V1Z7_CAPTE|nr:hypothetical protein CAPTEDRAFT_204007 [Capitella teleta]|eukprot:ELU10351.1 hypothetical protein CAPTEDRAFT_204007 [Capitella teleta]
MGYISQVFWTLIGLETCLQRCGSSMLNTKEVLEETCQLETFSPRCTSLQQIYITHSHYGHIKIGKCIKKDFGEFGCMADVTEIVRRRCNGKSRCQITAPDEEIVRTKPCVEGLTSYIETAYVCIPELTSIESCSTITLDRQWKYITSTQIEKTCMAQSQSMKIEAPPSINMEITAAIINEETLDVDRAYVMLSDDTGNTTQIDISRHSPTSVNVDSSAVYIIFENSKAILLFGFRAVGCKDMVAPDFTWIERQRNTLTIGCVHNEYTWQVKCIGSKWIGFRGNCTRQTEIKPDVVNPPEVEQKPPPNQTIFTKGIQYALTIGITVLFCVVVITSGFVCLKKAEYKAKASKGIELQEMTGDYSNTWKATLMRPVTNDLNNPNASPQQFYVLNQQNDTPIGTLR